MQTYKKSLTPYLILSAVLFVLFYTISNWLFSFTNADIIEVINFAFSLDGLNDLASNFHIYLLMFKPISLAAGLTGFFVVC